MEKPKRWHLALIAGVILLTVYNVLPTLFYYAKPLSKSIGPKEAQQTSLHIASRVNSLESFTTEWLAAQVKNLGLKAKSISLDPHNPRLAHVEFARSEEAALFAKTLPRAGALIPFAPAELTVSQAVSSKDTTVVVERKIGIHLNKEDLSKYFTYIPKWEGGEVTGAYRELIFDRLATLASGFGAASEMAVALNASSGGGAAVSSSELLGYARGISEAADIFGVSSPIAKRYFATFTQIDVPVETKQQMVQTLIASLEKLKGQVEQNISALASQEQVAIREGRFVDEATLQSAVELGANKARLESALQIVKNHSDLFVAGQKPLDKEALVQQLGATFQPGERYQTIDLSHLNPYIATICLDWKKEVVNLDLQPEVVELRKKAKTEAEAVVQEITNQRLYQEIARATRTSSETVTPAFDHFVISLCEVTGSTGLLKLDLKEVARTQITTLLSLLQAKHFESTDFSKENFPIEMASTQEQKKSSQFGLTFYAPILDKEAHPGFKNSSLYVIAHNFAPLARRYESMAPSYEKSRFENDAELLNQTFRQNGFISYLGSEGSLDPQYKNDVIFELDDFYAYLIAATRENFTTRGSHTFALLEFTDVEQRLLAENRIDISAQEDLLRWKDEYEAARASADPTSRLYVPAPIESPFWSNLKLATKLYLRGDERKTLRWGLDLAGGKTVRIGLKDQAGRAISNEADLKQAIDELYLRVNKLGVSEVSIRSEGSTLVIDFPGSQALSAQDLVKASAMTFHVVNEKFSLGNAKLAESVHAFLEEVWNEAVITGRKDIDSVNQIAWQHLGGDPQRPEEFHPLTPHARQLVSQGLRLANPKSAHPASAFNDSLSKIAILRGNSVADWQGSTNPLLIVFYNYALEGSNLTDIAAGYDQREGNVLSFGVKSSSLKEGSRFSPRDDFYAWTSQFSQEKIAGTDKESYTNGRGWRMAVVLNGSVVSSPALQAALRDNARITGHFSQREINQLAADLKAGSLSFTPHILSEENVSPDLGHKQRVQGVAAALLGLVLVVALMCIYYRFGGVVASVAVLFNLLIIWGVLQNLGAAITLPGIAAIILTVGMSVDANVLVFERIREEFAISKKLGAALFAGYKKAFSAIVDSNLTTIIAALILLNFDSGPIKGFALTLIIGIVSSMFTSLFMTRAFFARWIQNPGHKELKMMHLFEKTNFNFLSRANLAYILSVVAIGVGLVLFYAQRKTVLGMDFTGGYALTVDLVDSASGESYREQTIAALERAHVSAHDFQVRELSRPNELRIQLSAGLDERGGVFYNEAAPADIENPLFVYQENPRIVWIVKALQSAGLKINPASLPSLHLHWTEMSGQLSDAMRNQAIMGLVLALIAILIYITVRFEFKYAIAATLGLVHDVLLTLALFAVIHLFYSGLVLDLQVIAALMTIIGYSLNDTIIVFDRVREDLKIHRKMSFAQIVNDALNRTLSRTIMTSGTTLIALLALVLFGGRAIFNFSLVMAIGVLLGTLSSLYIATPLLVYFHKRENKASENHSKTA